MRFSSVSRGFRASRPRASRPRNRRKFWCAARQPRCRSPASSTSRAERTRLSKERDRLKADVAKIDAKLANADFVKRAPEEVVEEQRERREAALARIAKLDEALKRLG